MEKPPDLDAYFARIAYSGPRAPTVEVLRSLVAQHITAIPFENLDVLLGRGINLPSIRR
jgi:N-hydroxyarylamine O-acetyltransferase